MRVVPGLECIQLPTFGGAAARFNVAFHGEIKSDPYVS